MLQPVLGSSRDFTTMFREESGDEELSVLPRHTKVIVRGNNRTKSVLVGLQGVVKKAVGLGGWHWLVLKNGTEVKLQRNALSVLEHPTGNELDDDDNDDDGIDISSSGSDVGEDHDFSCSFEFPRLSKHRIRQTKPCLASSLAKANRNSYRDVQSILHTHQSRVNFAKLATNTLRRYSTHYNLPGISADSSREQILNAVQLHFASQTQVNEERVISDFVVAAKRMKQSED